MVDFCRHVASETRCVDDKTCVCVAPAAHRVRIGYLASKRSKFLMVALTIDNHRVSVCSSYLHNVCPVVQLTFLSLSLDTHQKLYTVRLCVIETMCLQRTLTLYPLRECKQNVNCVCVCVCMRHCAMSPQLVATPRSRQVRACTAAHHVTSHLLRHPGASLCGE